jgi:hypothetical protein
MKKNQRERTVKFLEAQAFTFAVMQSLRETGAVNSRMVELASNAHSIAAQAIGDIVDKHPRLAKTVDKIFKEITVTNEQK